MATIPLPALSVNTQQESPLAMYAKIQQIKAAQTQQQTAGLQQTGLEQENQQRALALKDQQTLRSIAPNHLQKDADGNVTGFDTEGLLKEAAGKGVNPQTLNQMRLGYADTVSKLATADKETRDNEQARNKTLYETLESVRSIKDPQQRQAALIQSLPTLKKQGVDISKIQANQPISDDMLDFDEAGLGMHAQMVADAEKKASIGKTIQETKTSAATQAHTEMETAQGGPPATRELNDWLAKHPGKGPADYEEYMKKIVPAYNFNLQNNSGAGKPAADVAKQFGMSPEAFDQAAEKYYQTGNLPPVGRGPAGPALQKAIMNRTGELHSGASLAEGSAEYKANADSLKKLQGNLDSVSAFESTALKNLQLFRTQAQKVIDTGIPLLNAPLRSAAKMLGSENQAGFETSLQVANNEIAKVTSSPGLSGVLSDSARKEVENYNPKNATIGQAMHVADILEQDMANRHKSYQDQINDIKGRMGGKMGGNANQSQAGGKFSIAAPNGKTYSFPDQASLDAFKQKAGIR